MLLNQTFFLFLGLILLIQGADILLSAAIALGKRYRVSDFLIGMIIVGFGTSLSELLVSVDAILKNSPDLAVGNVIGSNVSNLLLVLGFSLLVSTCKINKISKFDILFHFKIHLLFLILFVFFELNNLTGSLFIILFVIYMFICLKKQSKEVITSTSIEEDFISKFIFSKPLVLGLPIFIFSIFLTVLGAKLTVNSALEISDILGISESFLGLSIIAIGTSLPEIITSIRAAFKLKSEIILGNIIGSNIYNLLLILGITSIVGSFTYNKEVLFFEVIFLGFSTFIFSLIIYFKKEVKRTFSILFLFLYAFYLVRLYQSNF